MFYNSISLKNTGTSTLNSFDNINLVGALGVVCFFNIFYGGLYIFDISSSFNMYLVFEKKNSFPSLFSLVPLLLVYTDSVRTALREVN